MRPVVAGNWKMNKTLEEARVYVEKIHKLLLKIRDTDVIFCPPFTALFGIKEQLGELPAFLGAQNCHWESSGAWTGEVSVEMLKAVGVDVVILGHSERRHIFNEPDEWINKKVLSALKGGLKPVFCIGETIEERKQGRTNEILHHQIQTGLGGLEDGSDLILAYEPVWAIGTGLNADQDQIHDAHQFVLEELTGIFGQQGRDIPVLYGGSVKPDNAGELFKVDGVSGFLVGGASLKVEDFISIVDSVNEIQKGV